MKPFRGEFQEFQREFQTTKRAKGVLSLLTKSRFFSKLVSEFTGKTLFDSYKKAYFGTKRAV